MQFHRFFLIALLTLASCTLDRSGLGPARPDFVVRPTLICLGEPVTISWEILNLRRDRSFCAMPDGGYSTRTACVSSRDCPSDGSCFDGLCVRRGTDINEVDFGIGCFEPSTITVTASPGTGGIPVNAAPTQRGSAMHTPRADTVYTALVGRAGAVRPAQTRSVAVVPAEGTPPLLKPVTFANPLCGRPTGPVTLEFPELLPDPIIGTDRVAIVEVRNDSAFSVAVETAEPGRGPVSLSSREMTTVLNGPTGRFWTVTPLVDPLTPGLPPSGRCDVAGAPPPEPMTLTLSLTCRPE